MQHRLTPSRLANLGARVIHNAFLDYTDRFMQITRRAQARFDTRDWNGMQADAAERLDLYRAVVDGVEVEIRKLLDDRLQDRLVWSSMKAVYSGRIDDHDTWELAESFFNSITRRLFDTVGVDPRIEFVTTDFEAPPTPSRHAVYHPYNREKTTAALLASILSDTSFETPFQDLQRDAQLAADRIEAHLRDIGALRTIEHTEMISRAFFRGKGAYLIGRMFSGSHLIPLVLALFNTPDGIVVDAVLVKENDVSVLFSFANSYFHVEVDRPFDLVHLLKTILPRKRLAELYIAIGHNKHGKTEFYRDLLRHLAYSDDTFEIARGKRGMVMAVFTLPTYDVVFKVIKDRFPPPKQTTREAIMSKYDLVFKHDRAGRLVDAQAFEHLKFDRQRFSPELLDHLLDVAGETVRVHEDQVIIDHAYVERRVIPLNIYVREALPEAARAAVTDYGQTLKDLAASNIFAGDLLLKNFGVTRHGRVVFYDYDELALLTDCNFRAMPPPRSDEDEMASEPWFYVHESDIFPEELKRFLGLPKALREVFMAHHADLFAVDFWQQTQAHIRAGQMIHIFPYERAKRLHAS